MSKTEYAWVIQRDDADVFWGEYGWTSKLRIANFREKKEYCLSEIKVYKYLVDEIRYNKYGFSIVSYIDSVPFYFNEKIPKTYVGILTLKSIMAKLGLQLNKKPKPN